MVLVADLLVIAVAAAVAVAAVRRRPRRLCVRHGERGKFVLTWKMREWGKTSGQQLCTIPKHLGQAFSRQNWKILIWRGYYVSPFRSRTPDLNYFIHSLSLLQLNQSRNDSVVRVLGSHGWIERESICYVMDWDLRQRRAGLAKGTTDWLAKLQSIKK